MGRTIPVVEKRKAIAPKPDIPSAVFRKYIDKQKKMTKANPDIIARVFDVKI